MKFDREFWLEDGTMVYSFEENTIPRFDSSVSFTH